MKIKLFILPFLVSIFCLIPFASKADNDIFEAEIVQTGNYSFTYEYKITYDSSSGYSPYIIGYNIPTNNAFGWYLFAPSSSISSVQYRWNRGDGFNAWNELSYNIINDSVSGLTFKEYVLQGGNETSVFGDIIRMGPLYFAGSFPNDSIASSSIRSQYFNFFHTDSFPMMYYGDPQPDGSFIYEEPAFPDSGDWIPNYDIPNPVVSWNGIDSAGGKWMLFAPQNARSNYYIEVRGAVYTFNDFSLVRNNLKWYNYYDSVYWLTNNGHVRWETYIAPSDMQSAYVDGNISIGSVAIEQVADLQSITATGPYQVLNNLTKPDEVSKVGYQNCLGQMHNNPLVWVGHKIYLRYFTYENGVVQYSKWTPYDFPIAKSGSNAFTELPEDPQIGEPDGGDGTDQDPNPDPDQPPDVDTGGGGDDDGNNKIPIIDPVDGIFSSIINWLNTILNGINNVDHTIINFFNSSVNMLGQFPVLLARTFQFLPSWLISAISIGLAISIILRVFGR